MSQQCGNGDQRLNLLPTQTRAQQRSWVSSMSTTISSSSRSCLTRFLVFPRCHERRLFGGTSHGVGRSSTVANGDACRMTCLGTVWLFALLCVCFTELKFNFAVFLGKTAHHIWPDLPGLKSESSNMLAVGRVAGLLSGSRKSYNYRQGLI